MEKYQKDDHALSVINKALNANFTAAYVEEGESPIEKVQEIIGGGVVINNFAVMLERQDGTYLRIFAAEHVCLSIERPEKVDGQSLELEL